jgi:hypothetical protein
VVATVVAHPSTWPAVWRTVRAMAPQRWWRRPPFLPVPPRRYLEFRLLTHYGSTNVAPSGADVMSYISWCADEHSEISRAAWQ